MTPMRCGSSKLWFKHWDLGAGLENSIRNRTKPLEIYAIEADKAFHVEYKSKMKKNVKLLPYAAWIRNETLFFEITRDPRKKKAAEKGRGMGRIHPV
ncbi:hypothetical protein COLO4_32719 [Corchorus olitorius]|uniref:Uncharacterized protein n=1 Tax=Corchorus olitorius TaxID=93759 RepID=A0A1R3GYA7_9ROSI|nr:hypothetical protein COLO4_32719 [Corchorus olitorius]